MTAITYRMGAGSAGDVTRFHPASIHPFLNDPAGQNPSTYFGQALLFHGATNTVRAVNNTNDSGLGNTTVALAGITVRPFPTQDTGAGEVFGAAPYGGGGPVAGSEADVLTQGSILVTQNQPTGTFPAVSTLGGTVYVRVVTSTNANFSALPVGGFESVVDPVPANQFKAQSSYWRGGADQFGVAEIVLID